jgi:hypothetical protein
VGVWVGGGGGGVGGGGGGGGRPPPRRKRSVCRNLELDCNPQALEALLELRRAERTGMESPGTVCRQTNIRDATADCKSSDGFRSQHLISHATEKLL